MYESKETSIKRIVVTILLIILVICILLWIFPIKKFKKNGTENELTFSEKFNYNLKVLQNAGFSYYYTATQPKNNGDKTSISLANLVKKGYLIQLKDDNGNLCDQNNSYVELTKNDKNDYELKSYLKCGNEENFTTKKMTCSNFKNNCKTTTKTVTKNTNKNTTTTNTKNNTVTYYRYLYSCPKNEKSYSNWSDWTSNYIASSSNVEVQTKVDYERKYVKVGTETKPVTTNVVETVTETKEEERRYVNTKPTDAKSCYSVARSSYTLYICKFDVEVKKDKVVPKVTYETTDVYGWKNTPVTYYRYRTVANNNSTYQIWSDSLSYKNMGCTIIKTEKITK